MNKTIRVVTVLPDKKPVVEEIEKGLRSLQKKVDGCIQAIYPFKDTVAIVCNEEAKLLNLPYNRSLRNEEGQVYDIISGTFFVVGTESEEFVSLTDEQVEKYSELFKQPEMFIGSESCLLVIPYNAPENP